jgi:septal ring-binding cell division protein DamX
MNRKNSARKGAGRKYQVELTSWSMFLWISCFSLLLAWVFVLGILVGRGFIPESVTAISDLKSQLSKLQEMVSHGKKPNPESVKKEDYDGKLAFYNELLNKRETDKGREVPEAKAEPQKRDPLQKKNATTEERLAEIRAEVSGREAIGQKKTDGHPEINSEERQRAQQQASSTRGGYTLQLASLEEKSKAEETMRKLIKRGHDAYIYEVQIRGKPRYRIRSGRFSTKEEAEEFAGKVVRETGLKGLVIRIE